MDFNSVRFLRSSSQSSCSSNGFPLIAHGQGLSTPTKVKENHGKQAFAGVRACPITPLAASRLITLVGKFEIVERNSSARTLKRLSDAAVRRTSHSPSLRTLTAPCSLADLRHHCDLSTPGCDGQKSATFASRSSSKAATTAVLTTWATASSAIRPTRTARNTRDSTDPVRQSHPSACSGIIRISLRFWSTAPPYL